ncbi:MAG: EamA family transporter [Nakamurella sp.]
MGIVLALISSVLWGIADFAGGTVTRRLPVLTVVAASQASGLLIASVVAAVTGAWTAPLGYLPWAIAAGIAGAVGLLAFYEALARGTMGIVSPIAALGVIVPVVVGLVIGHWPSVIVGIGFALAIIGIVAASGPERSAGKSMRPVLLALIAATCFGAVLTLIAKGAASSPVMTMVAMRATSVSMLSVVLVVNLFRANTGKPDRSTAARQPASMGIWVIVMTAGVFDVSANLTYAYASTLSALTIVAILGSLYPAVTVALARIVHGERMTHIQHVGIVVALAGVALIAGWA